MESQKYNHTFCLYFLSKGSRHVSRELLGQLSIPHWVFLQTWLLWVSDHIYVCVRVCTCIYMCVFNICTHIYVYIDIYVCVCVLCARARACGVIEHHTEYQKFFLTFLWRTPAVLILQGTEWPETQDYLPLAANKVSFSIVLEGEQENRGAATMESLLCSLLLLYPLFGSALNKAHLHALSEKQPLFKTTNNDRNLANLWVRDSSYMVGYLFFSLSLPLFLSPSSLKLWEIPQNIKFTLKSLWSVKLTWVSFQKELYC